MAEENKKVEETTEKTKVTKVKMPKVKKPIDDIIKVDLSKPTVEKTEEVKEEPIKEDIIVVNEEPKVEEPKQDDTPVLQEITNEEILKVKKEVEQVVVESENTGKPLPENVEKLLSFMADTGGDMKDYVNLNRDISKLDDSDVLDEYYRTTKSHLTPEERSFLLEDSFGYDEGVDDDKEIRKKKIALKEQVAEAKAHLDGQKSKYYEDIKAGSKLTPEQQKAIDFFNRHNKENEERNRLNEETISAFRQKTNKVFDDEFKGFDYKVGDKKFRFNVKNTNEVKETQSDLNNFLNKFVGEDKRTMEDAAGYHKSLFTAMNADAVAKHFYEQGQADAIKGQVAKDKNIDMNPRQVHGETEVGGVKYRVLGNDANDFKFKIKNKNKK
tara:strand:- start:1401 stop:2549 length:1149 start_codon:yes stop_codon:yes gene_type:complete